LILVESGHDQASELFTLEIRTQSPGEYILGGKSVIVITNGHSRSPFGLPPSCSTIVTGDGKASQDH
jgi:hypothetical protein